MSVVGPGQLLFAFVRHWARRAAKGDGSVAEQGRLILVTDVVNTLIGRQEAATVNAVATEIGIDQSGASRLIKDAVDAGYLTMDTSHFDRRRREARITRTGRTTLRQAHAWQESVFDELTVEWSQTRRDSFKADMTDLIARSHLLNE